MHKISSILLTALLPVFSIAQIKPNNAPKPTPTQAVLPTPLAYPANILVNYVRTWEAMKPNTNPSATDLADGTKYKQATAYFDGLGRPLQEVVKGASPDGLKDLVSMHTYDAFGRETINFLPYPAIPNGTDAGKFKTDPFAATQTYYQTNYTDQRPYSQTEIESSPLNRPTKTMAPGNSWVGSGRGIEKEYLINTIDDEVRIWNIGYNTNIELNIPTTSINYPAGELYKNVTKDEHQKQVVEYLDKEGRVILKKVQLAGNPSANHIGWLCTYYVYDDFGLLRFVIQPKAVEQLPTAGWQLATDVVAELCFRYEYDGRQRMIAKKVPGAGWVYMCYDKRDRLVYTQDANMRDGKSWPPAASTACWMATFYDALNRPTETALYKTSQSRDQLQTALNNLDMDTQPTPSIAEADLYRLSYTYYDDYTFAGAATFDATQLTATQTNYQLGDEVADNTGKATSTRGLVTGTKTRVLNTAGTWQTATTYYDVNGKPLQATSTNHKSGTDVVTTQYSFTGKVISTVSKHNNPAATLAGTQTTTIQQTTLYSNNFAVSTKQKINSDAWHQISTVQYDDMGKAKRKEMGNGYTMDGNAEKFFTNFSYNIRGWLTGINKSEYQNLSPIFGSEFYKPIFSQTLSYDYGFDNNSAQFNGNISGIQWTHADDKVKRAFGYQYDAANRLKKADFNQNDNGTWANTNINYNVSNLNYDANGNILSMTQYGLKIGTTNHITDQLEYGYLTPNNNSLSNKLRKVTDNSLTGGAGGLGDFKNGTNGSTDDYDYDLNGNLKYDKNKDISNIAYNYLNLPHTIAVTGKGTITYTYDATGNKLQKLVTPTTGSATSTDYLGAFQYQNNELQQVAHAEGRVRYAKRQTINGQTNEYYWNYDFYYKDHLGNIRETVTEEQDVLRYTASMENHRKEIEESVFDKLPQTREKISEIVGYPSTVEDIENKYTSKVNGSLTNGVGPSLVLKVMAGDRYDLSCISWYNYPGGEIDNHESPQTTISDYLFTELLGLMGGQLNTTSSHGSLTNQNISNQINTGLNAFLNNQGGSYESDGAYQKPKAYLNWMLFDEQFKPVPGPDGSGFEAVGGSEEYKIHVLANLPVVKSGYLYVWVSNETYNINVFFDNLTVVHRTGPLLQSDDYYPFGLTMAGISSKAAGALTNKNKYQTYELNTDFDLNLNESFYRTHDPQLGRFWQPDPKAVDEISLYAAMDNNPISKTDYLGDRTRMYSDDGTYIGDINTKNGDYASIFSGDNAGAAALVMGLINKFEITNEKLLGLLENAVRGIGDNYDLASFEKFADENKSEIKTFLGHDVGDVSNVRIEDMGTHEKSSLKGKHAEQYGNVVLDGNVLKVGDSKNFRTWNDFNTGYPGELPNEKNKASYIHDHPIGNNGTEIYFNYVTRDQNGKVNGGGTNQRAFAGGGPSPPDTGFAGQFKYRSVVVDRNNIYLTQGDKNIITIERKK